MVSNKLRSAIKLSHIPAYKIAHLAGIDPTTLSKLICGIVKVKHGDQRVIKIGKIFGLRPDECFKNNKEHSA